jgi:2-polyprenyl-3-methyl-5-hydroxy-6-metoxy-1,4-benzoquinol methylase
MSPLPTVSELSDYYQKYDVLGEHEPYYQDLWGVGALNSPAGRDIRERFAWAKGLCKNFGRTLDIGSGPGIFLRLVKDDGGEAVGVELNARAAERSGREAGVRVVSGSIDNVIDRNFDTITLWDLLEHVHDPKQLVADCSLRLKLGGWLFIETPNEASFLDRAVLALLKLGIKGPASTFYGLHHLVLFRPPTVRRLLEENGFKIIEIRGVATDPGRIFRGNGFKDRMARLGVGVLFLAARLVGRQNKMLIAAKKMN